MICPEAEFWYDGNYGCGVDGGECDDPYSPCDAIRDFVDFGDGDDGDYGIGDGDLE
jgi:hypothetical protein